MKNLFLAIIFSVFAAGAASAQIKFEEFNWEKLSEKSAEENKLIMVDMTATWCYWCKVMEKKVFPKEEVGEFYNANYISTKLYDTHPDAAEFSRKYKVDAFPTFLILDSKGNLVHRIDGAVTSPKEFVKEGERILSLQKEE